MDLLRAQLAIPFDRSGSWKRAQQIVDGNVDSEQH